MSYPNFIFSVFAFLGFTVCCIPFPRQLKASNTGTCLYMVWTGLACLNQFANSIIWNDNTFNWAPVWCDISSRFMIGTAVAFPACSLCINRRLYNIASLRLVTGTVNRRAVIVDMAIGIGLPVVAIILQYIPQGHRFNIYGEIGCYPFTSNNPVGIALVWAPPVVIGCASGVYSVINIRILFFIHAPASRLYDENENYTRYIRPTFIASVYGLCIVPLGVAAIYLNCAFNPNVPWKGWEENHSHFSSMDQIPALRWRQSPGLEASLEFNRWLVVAHAFVFFSLFGLHDEARGVYSTFCSFAKYFKARVSTSTSQRPLSLVAVGNERRMPL